MLELDSRPLLWLPHVFFENFGLRPSQFWLIREMDYDQKFGSCLEGKGTVLDMITKSEDWLKDNGIEKDTINIINEKLQKFGIHIGMSATEMLKALDKLHLKSLEDSNSEDKTS